MAINCVCPSCGQEVSAPVESAGKSAKCPKCGSLFRLPDEEEPAVVSAPRPRHMQEDEPRRREGRFRCPYCNSSEMPRMSEEISVGGWVLFAILIFVCIFLCWIPLITMKEQKRYCYTCGMKLG